MPSPLKPLLHIVIWVLIYLMPHFIAYGGDISMARVLDGKGVIHAVSTLLLVGYAYLNYGLLIPRFYFRKQFVAYVLLVAVAALTVIWLPNLFGPGPPDMPEPPALTGRPPMDHGPGGALWFGLGYNVILFIVITLGGIGWRQQLQLLESQRERMDAELSFLKAQINPHFLFNTLNSIYALALQKSDDTPTAIIQLSGLMRYLLKEANSDLVPLSMEIGYISNYVALQRRRLGDTVSIDYEVPEATSGHQIAPLILVSFVENAFKHGVNPDGNSRISICLRMTAAGLDFTVVNNKVGAVNREETTGIGLQNTTGRLHHLYSGRHRLDIKDETDTFSVHLSIDLS